ncbi:fluoride efflux transporter CrcB [Desulforamulus hydrothermalis]|uniref:Fluoride-specific ion channel FluC n=1 Tax=Desulforamulus hydrothermalis Lam5 = DSM 18033 TaxID=1121428 RepID=K8E9N5_9FIRM|nr:fluoride efflux transporter CrcB [Desulforamulus hydrothermalis]CCO08293.1 Protein CrcB homolog 1 [Desulforamulus hydrothermalis Lam5 = DSM 18033]SHH37926.1 CrcB protein [Desulforamulus hydrothermalis Lam5 = DSM 18033]
MLYLFVGAGGIAGAVCRYCIGTLVNGLAATPFPYGTLSVNLIGSFLLSFIAYSSLLRWQLRREYLLAINTGIIGSFTTFSTFSVEVLHLLLQKYLLLAFEYIFISLAGGLLLSWLGIRLASLFYQKEETAKY